VGEGSWIADIISRETRVIQQTLVTNAGNRALEDRVLETCLLQKVGRTSAEGKRNRYEQSVADQRARMRVMCTLRATSVAYGGWDA